MAKRVHRQLKKQLEEQKSLEEELKKLQSAKDPKESCAEVIKFVQNTSMDPMLDTENNPFAMNCFIGDTKILISKTGKHKKIKEMKVGDVIICVVPTHVMFKESIDCDIKEISDHFCDAMVTAIHKSFTNYISCIKYRYANSNQEGTVQCTNSHPIYVNKQGWKTVSGKTNENEFYKFKTSPLKIGDEVCLETNQIAYVTSIHSTFFQNAIPVYNLTASIGHTFFANGLFVHNKGCECVVL